MDDTFDPAAFREALERGSVMLFDSIDISVTSADLERAYAQYAAQFGRGTLADTERRQALVNWILAGRPR